MLLLAVAITAGLVVWGAPGAGGTHISCQGQGVPHQFLGTSGNDTIIGNDSANVMAGLAGDDTIEGRGGGDTICGNEGRDTIRGQGGNDSINSGDNVDPDVSGGDGNDSIHCGAFGDTCSGGNGGDFVDGDDGPDNVSGNADVDTLEDGLGAAASDLLTGGAGIDTFNVCSAPGEGATITDAQAGETINFGPGFC